MHIGFTFWACSGWHFRLYLQRNYVMEEEHPLWLGETSTLSYMFECTNNNLTAPAPICNTHFRPAHTAQPTLYG